MTMFPTASHHHNSTSTTTTPPFKQQQQQHHHHHSSRRRRSHDGGGYGAAFEISTSDIIDADTNNINHQSCSSGRRRLDESAAGCTTFLEYTDLATPPRRRGNCRSATSSNSSRLPMAAEEDESRTNSNTSLTNEAATSTSKNAAVATEPEIVVRLPENRLIAVSGASASSSSSSSWLQLSIGGGAPAEIPATSNKDDQQQKLDPRGGAGGGGLIELDLLSSGSFYRPPFTPTFLDTNVPPPPLRPVAMNVAAAAPPPPSFFFQPQQLAAAGGMYSSSSYPPLQYHQQQLHHQQDINYWPFSRAPLNTGGSAVMHHHPQMAGPYFARPFQLLGDPGGGGGPAGASSSDNEEFRVMDPPRRPHSGIWFLLQPSLSQSKEPFLPPLHKSYLRIKDGRMTVRLLIKYLVTKLGLDSDSEIEITCRGQKLPPFLTLQHVRDNIWSSRREGSGMITLLADQPADSSSSLSPSPANSPASSSSDHLMILHYARTTATATATTTC